MAPKKTSEPPDRAEMQQQCWEASLSGRGHTSDPSANRPAPSPRSRSGRKVEDGCAPSSSRGVTFWGWGHRSLCLALRPGAAAGMPVTRPCASPRFTTHAVNGPFTQLFSLSPFDRDSKTLGVSLSKGSSGIWEGCGNARRVQERSVRGGRVEGSLQKRRWGDSWQAPSFPN